jgi:hypothetical protein
MSTKRQPVKAIQNLLKQFRQHSPDAIKEQSLWLLRNLIITRRRSQWVNAGFVLPTVAMVALVVVLLTTAILFRSFERSKNASNVRVNEAVLSAASPALERARAKVDRLFKDPRLPRSTPSDLSLAQVISENINQFTFGDETQLTVASEFNPASTIAQEKISNTAWKYPVDTDNDGKFDSYTLYGIYYKTPTSQRKRSTVEARTQPMDEGSSGSKCKSDVATSANLVGTQGWYKVGGKLKRSIFVYTTIVPITEEPTAAKLGKNYQQYQKFKGNRGFAALEYQQDRERIPLNNNAVLYDDDLEIAPGAGLQLNGRIFTNGNFLTTKTSNSGDIRFYLVSSPESCYYTEENSKIIVAGNVINSRANMSATGTGGVKVDLYNNLGTNTGIDGNQKTVPGSVFGDRAAYNDEAYARRINRLVEATIAESKTLPDDVTKEINRDMAADQTLTFDKARKEQLTIYFRQRTRRVPYAEVGFGANALGTYSTATPLQGNANSLRPKDEWVFPFNPANGTNATGYAEIGIKDSGNKLFLSATDPKVQVKLDKEELIGDRVLVGNNLPQFWYDTTKNKFISAADGAEQAVSAKVWDNTGGKDRKRFPQAFQLDDLGITDRDDFWEKSAAQPPQGALDVVGGLRVVTGAGIYLPNGYPSTSTAAQLTAATTATKDIVWADTMPTGVTTTAQGLPNNLTPQLQMRATVVYHYQDDSYNPQTPANYQTPIACVSSYYDPTNSRTATNRQGLPDVRQRVVAPASINTRALSLATNVSAADAGNSRNGVVYAASNLSPSSYLAVLNYQANLKYPNGRLVNEQLKKAVDKGLSSGTLSLAEQSAVDSAVCALKIMDGTIGAPTDAAVPHGAIMETAFLDGRQIKTIDRPGSSRAYDLDVELRQPLEVRTTIIDLDLLRRKSKGNNAFGVEEFLLPNSGIIYATRDDALADRSDTTESVSATDFRLDATRRPNGIMLINGSRLDRQTNYRAEEKGLILASNLPVYIQAQRIDNSNTTGYFNRHTQEEFSDNSLKGSTNWSSTFYARKNLNPEFACRPNQFGSGTCATGETWRPASIIADSITILSSNFRLGFREEGDYDLRDNASNLAVGYDLDGNGTIGTTAITLDETALKLDLNGDGDMLDTSVGTLDETKIQADIDGDGNITNTAAQIKENNLTGTVVARLNGFWDNNFVTSLPWQDNNGGAGYANPTDLSGNPLSNSSYFNNFVSPVQRRVPFAEYVMEICRKPTIAACTANDWMVGYDANNDNNIDWANAAENLKANQITPNNASYTVNKLGAGTTARPPLNAADRRFPRRIAFLRDTTTSNLILTGAAPNRRPIPLGISGVDNPATATADDAGQVNYYPFDTYTTSSPSVTYNPYASSPAGRRPRLHRRALWFKTINSATANYGYNFPLWIENRTTLAGATNTEQPLLVPVLQIQYPFAVPGVDSPTLTESNDIQTTANNWLQRATATETNLVFTQGNTPARPTETNGGLENFVRYLENWNGIGHTASGAFIQFKRSVFATAPWQIVTAGYNNADTAYSSTGTIFGYPQGYRSTVTSAGGNMGRSPFYAPPSRLWGYDVALLTQLPDLFSQRFASPSTAEPNEFYREVARDDDWVKSLLCAAQSSTTGGYENASQGYGSSQKYAIPKDQRPSSCQ